jgi:catechol 2,3-dioxygenase-like lactoylglutathione lyase family enzyme
MFKIGKNFHVIHMTDDLQTLDAWYDDVFSVHRFMKPSYMEAEVRDASLVLIGDLCIEPLAPSFHVEGWDTMPLGRFYAGRGRRWHSIAWYLDSREGMADLFHALKEADVRLFGTGGVRQTGEEPRGAIFTHPRDTGTQLEFVPGPRKPTTKLPPAEYAGPMGLADPRFEPDFNPGWWSDHHPLQLVNSSHVTIAVEDLERSRAVYTEVLGGDLLYEGPVDLTETTSAFVAVGDDLIVELAKPNDSSSLIGADVERFHDNLYSVTFKVRDLEGAATYLASKGIKAALNDGATLFTDPETTHGVVMGFTTRDIPNDRRPNWAVRSAR